MMVSSQLYGYLRINEVTTHVTWASFVWRTGVNPSATYYSTPARAWEPGAGALLALGTTWVCRLPPADADADGCR